MAHELTVVSQDGALPRTEGVGFCPSQGHPQAQHALVRIGVLAPGSSVTYSPGMPIAPPARVNAINELST